MNYKNILLHFFAVNKKVLYMVFFAKILSVGNMWVPLQGLLSMH